ncbi:MAG: AHH domain-containing protein [Lachnospiraceae bacterium]|nr:AHH domain-containing protein [Lachnospiraceae bacterium]
MEQIYFHGFTDEEDRKVKQRMEDFKKISQTARIPEAGMNELKNHINMVFYDLDSVVDEVNASMKSVQDMIELEPIDTTSLAESFDDVKSYINKKEEMIAMLDADFCNNEISELEKLIFATKNLIQDYKNSDRHIERYQTGDYIDRGHFLELYEALAKSQIYNQTNATGIQEAIEHQNQISREIYEELESEERFEAGFMQVVGGALVAVSAIATVASCGAAYPALNVTAAGLATVGTADATEGVQEMYYGLQCDVETKSFHAIRDTVFRGNEEHYQYFNSALNIASLVIFPVSMGAKTAASKGTSMVAGGAKNLAIAGASTLAGYGVEKFAEQQGASNTTTMARGLITNILTEKGLENRTSAVTKRIKAYANSTDTLKLKVRIQNTLTHKKTAIKVSLSNGRERVLELKNGFWEKGSKFLENVEKLKNGDFYQHEYVMPEGYRVKVSDFDDVPKNGTVYSRGSGESGTKTKPNQVHHFATNKSKKYTSQFESIAKKYGLNLDGDWNKELMPHQGRHPYAYHDYVLDNMQKFDRIANGDKTKFLKLYDQMIQKIINNPDMLYKDYWKK